MSIPTGGWQSKLELRNDQFLFRSELSSGQCSLIHAVYQPAHNIKFTTLIIKCVKGRYTTCIKCFIVCDDNSFPIELFKVCYSVRNSLAVYHLLFLIVLSKSLTVKILHIDVSFVCFRYVFKRLRFLGNKDVSQLLTLVFLALWHGLHTGYFMCFFLEFLIVSFEKSVSIRSTY